MVAALRVARQVVVRSSAALRKTAALSSHGQLAHSRRAAAAATIACPTCSFEALCQSARTKAWSWGITAFAVSSPRTSLPPMTSGISMRSPTIAFRRARSSARSGDPGA
jgi:hypothetical protein